ncbi:hypothetical protein [Cupriavidus lacunae]|nr:hypothetical protein [Cupriavidus lacunae]
MANERGNPIIDTGHGYNPLIDPKILLDYEEPEPQARDKQRHAL